MIRVRMIQTTTEVMMNVEIVRRMCSDGDIYIMSDAETDEMPYYIACDSYTGFVVNYMGKEQIINKSQIVKIIL